jgi:hypothetical protein
VKPRTLSEEDFIMPNQPNSPKNVKDQITGAAQQAGTEVKERAQQAAGAVADKARDLAATARDAATTAGKRADDAAGAVGERMQSAADTLRREGPHEGYLGSASTAVAGALEKGGKYLKEEKLSGLAADITEVVKKYPIHAVLIGFGLGYLMSRSNRG